MARKSTAGKSLGGTAKRIATRLPAVKPIPSYGSNSATYNTTSRVGCGVCGVTSSISTPGFCPPHQQEYEVFLKLTANNGLGTNGQLFLMYKDLLTRISVLEDALEIKRIKEMYE